MNAVPQNRVLVSLLVGIVLLLASSGVPRAQQSPVVKSVVTFGKSVKPSGTEVTVSFDALVEDSRCPTGANCIWAGDAAVVISVSTPGASSGKYTLHSSSQFVHEVEHDGNRVTLLEVAPYPVAGAVHKPQEYVITLSIKRK